MIDTAPTKHAPVATVREWTIALGVLTAGNMTRAEAEIKLRAYVPLLQDQFPAGAFTQNSLHHVASACKWFPSYAEVIDHLRNWWRANRPTPPALPPPPRPPPREVREPLTPEQLEQLHELSRRTVAVLRSSAAEHEMVITPRGPRYLTPAQLDLVNPLPEGRKRYAEASEDDRATTATVDSDAATTDGAAETDDAGLYPARDDIDED